MMGVILGFSLDSCCIATSFPPFKPNWPPALYGQALAAIIFDNPHTGTAVVALTRSSTKLVLQSCTLGCLSSVSMMKRL